MKIKYKNCSKCGISQNQNNSFSRIYKNKIIYFGTTCKSCDIKRTNIVQIKRRKIDPIFKLSSRMRIITNRFLKNKKTKGTENIIGCTFIELKQYLENKFTSEMTWNNYGTLWHIDHIKPLCSAKSENEVYKLNHYTNLQPLLAAENMAKGGKY